MAAKRTSPGKDLVSTTAERPDGDIEDEVETCKACGKTFQLLNSHILRSKACKSKYSEDELTALKERDLKLRREKNAQRMKANYHNDPTESPRKRAAMKKLYEDPKRREAKKEAMKKLYEDPERREAKKETMSRYNEDNREEINSAMKDKYESDGVTSSNLSQGLKNLGSGLECPICKEKFYHKKLIDQHIKHQHSDDEPIVTCQICDKTFGHHNENLARHMREVHGGEKYKCDKCPAAYSRNSDLQKHISEGDHYLTYYCKQCQKELVFKHLGGLIKHVIVKQSEGEQESGEYTWKIHKSGMLVTCKSQVESTQLEEGEHVLCMPKEDKVKAYAKRKIMKEEIINEGLKLVKENPENVCVKLTLEYQKHEVDDGKRSCKWCKKSLPCITEFCSCRKPIENWIGGRE